LRLVLQKGLVGIVVAGVALAALMALAILAGLPGMAEAQEEFKASDTGAASTEAEQNTTTTTTTTTTTNTDEKGAPAAVWQPAPAAPSTTRLVVEPGNSLWSISEEHIGPGATPGQIAYEVERTFELNRDQIGEDPNLIFPGQELVLVPPASDTAAAVVAEPAVAQQAPKPIVAESEGVSNSPVSEEAVPENGVSEGAVSEDAIPTSLSRDQTDEQAENAPAESAPAESAPAESAPAESVPAESVPAESVPATTAVGGIAGSLLEAYDNFRVERRLLGIGILALTLIVASLMAWRMPMRRNVEDPMVWGIPQEYYENYAPPKASPEASPESAKGLEDETSSPTSGAPEEPTLEPSTNGSSTTSSSSSPSMETEGAMPEEAMPKGAPAAGSARGQERLRRGRHLRRIYQNPPPRRTR
jgi:LysM repeat protein